MYPSKPNANGASTRDSDTSKVTVPYSALGQTHGPMDFSSQSTNPSVPLPPSYPYIQTSHNMHPPPYTLAVTQDSSGWNNRPGSFSVPNPSAPVIAPGLANQVPYPAGGLSFYGNPAQAPYPTGPVTVSGLGSNPPHATRPGFGPGITNHQPFSIGSGISNPMASMPNPGLVDTYPGDGCQQGMIYPMESGAKKQYIGTSQYMPKQHAQQQPNVVYVVHKNAERDNANIDDEICFWGCCMASCCCLAECLKASTS